MKAKIRLKSSSEGELIADYVAMGDMTVDGGKVRLVYDEDNGASKTVTTLEAQKDNVTITRKGEISSVLMFSPNSNYDFNLVTEYGEIPMSLYADRVDFDLKDEKFSLELEYVLSSSGRISRQKMELVSIPS